MVNYLDWEVVKEFYKEKFGIQGWTVELYANLDILSLCASGVSNESISKFLEIPEDDVEKVLMDTFEIKGWYRDFQFNPYKIYKDTGGDIELFRQEVRMYLITEPIIDKLYSLCETMKDIEERINDEWI